MVFVYKGDIMGKPRMTQRDKWAKRPCVTRYRDIATEMREQANEQCYTPYPSIKAIIGIKMPKSWTKKKKREMLGKPHQQRPDVDNITKAIMDILCKEDSFIYHIDIKKFWSEESIVLLENKGNGEEDRFDFGHYLQGNPGKSLG